MTYNYMALFLSIVLGLSPEQAFAFIDSNVKCDKEDIGKIINVKITEAKTWRLNGEKE